MLAEQVMAWFAVVRCKRCGSLPFWKLNDLLVHDHTRYAKNWLKLCIAHMYRTRHTSLFVQLWAYEWKTFRRSWIGFCLSVVRMLQFMSSMCVCLRYDYVVQFTTHISHTNSIQRDTFGFIIDSESVYRSHNYRFVSIAEFINNWSTDLVYLVVVVVV